MNSWREIWTAYFSRSTTLKILLGTFIHASWADRIFLVVTAAGFAVGIWCYIVLSRASIIPMLGFEMLILFRLFSLKESLVLEEFGDKDASQTPPDDDSHRETRYLMFKDTLMNKGLTHSHVSDCFDLIDMQIDIAATSGQNYKKFFSFSLGAFLGLLGSFWHGQSMADLIYFGGAVMSFGLFGTLLISAFPSRIERLKELKYFMKLYCREGL